MVDFFTKIYPDAVSKKNPFLDRVRFYSLIRFLVRNAANAVLPIYFKITNLLNDYRLVQNDQTEEELIVSLTSFPARINKLHLVIETILRQSHLPDRIILWLSKEQFSDMSVLPKQLLKLRERGLEIEMCEGDLRSHKKYYYTCKSYPEAAFVIIDDDVFYPRDMLSSLVGFHKHFPDTVCFNRGHKIIKKNGEVLTYHFWELLQKQTKPQSDILPTGVGGVLYPPGVLLKETLNKDVFMECCKYADDLWLYVMTILNNKKLVKTNNNKLFLPVFNKGNQTLTSRNVQKGGNDKQFMAIREHYLEEKGIDLFEKIQSNN